MTDITKGVLDLHHEAGGLLWLSVVEQADILDLLTDAWAGDALAVRLSGCVADIMAWIEDAPRDKPFLCASCPRPVRGSSYYIVVATSGVDQPRHALGYAVCQHCAQTRDQAQDAILPLLRRIWTDLRQIPVPHTGRGRA